MAVKKTVDEIITIASKITGRDITDVIRSSKWGEYNFDDCRDDLESAYAVIRAIQELPVESLMEPNANKIRTHLANFRDAINSVLEFTVKQNDPEQNRDQLAQNLGEKARAVWAQIAPWIGYLFFQAGDVSDGLKKIAESRGQVDGALVNFLEIVDDGQKQISNAVAAAKEVAGKAGVGHFADDFSNEAIDHDTAAERWLKATMTLAVATGITAFLFSIFSQAPEKTLELLQYTTTRVVILGLLFTGTIWCSRMYRTNKHQQSVNKHRANALQTFQAFVEATSDPAVRDAVLLETTRSIFAITASGYLDDIDKSPDTGSRVVEVIKAASKTATEDKG